MRHLEMIVALGRNGLIGSSTGHMGLPWRISEDLRHFKKTTMGKCLIMGRTTYEFIGRPLPGRRNMVLSNTVVDIEGCEVFSSLDSALSAAYEGDQAPIIIGGASVYNEAMPRVTRLYLTTVDRDGEGDTFLEIPYDDFNVKEGRIADEHEDVMFSVMERGL